MSSVFLFGAGASYGSGACWPNPPPLGQAFFAALQAEGGIAASVSSDLAATFERNFEEGMDRFWIERNTDTTELLRDMAAYFAKFEPLPGNIYFELIKVLGGTRKKAVLVTTNYDLLIEHAIARSGLLCSYSGLPAPVRNVPILKIHGSCNFLPATNPKTIQGVKFDLTKSPAADILEVGVKIATSAAEIEKFCRESDSMAPAIAMYSPSKRVLFARQFVEMQKAQFHKSVKFASRIFIVGLRVHPVDTHIWEPLALAKAPLFYVGREPEQFIEWGRANQRSRMKVIATSFDESISKIHQQLWR